MVLRLRTNSPDWNRAKCLGEASGPEYDLFFDNSDDGFEDQTDLGRDICNGVIDGDICPIRHECLIWALVNNERYGIYGGTTEVDRRAQRKLWPWDPKNPATPHPEWRWRSHDELSELYRAAFSKLPTRADMEDDDDEDS